MLENDESLDGCPDPLFEEYTYPTMFGEAEVIVLQTEEGTPLRVLYVGGGFQSATYLGANRFLPVFEYCRAIDFVFGTGRPIRRMLMIGGGGFSYPNHLLMSDDPLHRNASIDVVEIDPAIVEIARRHFYLDEVERLHGPQGSGRLGIIVADGANALQAADSSAYDVVINDAFDGDELANPLLSPAALADAKRILTTDGLYLVNIVAESPAQAAPCAEVLREVFSCVYLLACPDEDFDGSANNLLIATDSPLDEQAMGLYSFAN